MRVVWLNGRRKGPLLILLFIKEKKMTRLTTLNLPSFHRTSVGFDRLFNELERTFMNSQSDSYPPYNVAELDEDKYMVTVAVAGFTMDDLNVTKDGKVLRIEGSKPKTDESVTYLHKGIGGRNFTREFVLADHVEVVEARLEAGCLNVLLQRQVPEELQPKKIEIKGAGETIEIGKDYQ